MKLLKTEFVANYDRVGNNKFTQIKKENGVAMYERRNMDGTFRSYEVFIVKVVAEGTPLPGGNKVQETYEQYPGCAAFGKTAHDCKHIDVAEDRFDDLVKKVKNSNDAKEEAALTGKPVRRGRKSSTNKVVVNVPNGKFTMKQLITNFNMSQAQLYPIVKGWVSAGLISVVDQIKPEGKGRPAMVYMAV